jgi:hypothetical protein
VRYELVLLLVTAVLGFHANAGDRVEPGSHEARTAKDVSEQDAKVRQLAALPVGIRVTHTPNPVKAQAGGRSGLPYTWQYETRVAAISEDVSIVEFGALVRKRPQSDSWELRTIYDRPFNAAEFADWYSCPGALVRKGTSCADPSNYTGSDRLEGFETRWYFIGRTRAGRLVKGEEIVRASPDTKKATPPG